MQPLQQSLRTDTVAYFVAVTFIFSTLYTIGKSLFGTGLEASIGLVICLVSGWYLWLSVKKIAAE